MQVDKPASPVYVYGNHWAHMVWKPRYSWAIVELGIKPVCQLVILCMVYVCMCLGMHMHVFSCVHACVR